MRSFYDTSIFDFLCLEKLSPSLQIFSKITLFDLLSLPSISSVLFDGTVYLVGDGVGGNVKKVQSRAAGAPVGTAFQAHPHQLNIRKCKIVHEIIRERTPYGTL